MEPIEPQGIGAIEVHFPTGVRVIPVRPPKRLIDAALEAHDIWEAHEEHLRVKVLKRLASGEMVCICHLPPIDG